MQVDRSFFWCMMTDVSGFPGCRSGDRLPMDTAALDLARFQFAFVISFHIVFPALTIGLGSYLAVWMRLAVDGTRPLHLVFSILGEGVCPHVRHGRRLRNCDELPVRHELERLLRQDRSRARAADGLRGADRVLSGGGLSRHHAVRREPRRRRLHFFATLMVAARRAFLRFLDPLRQ